jgi:hypothetical protein
LINISRNYPKQCRFESKPFYKELNDSIFRAILNIPCLAIPDNLRAYDALHVLGVEALSSDDMEGDFALLCVGASGGVSGQVLDQLV